MELLDNSGSTMQGLNVRLKGFLEQVNRLEVSNQRLESQIVDWSNKNVPQPRDLSKQERTINDLRAQVRMTYLACCVTTGACLQSCLTASDDSSSRLSIPPWGNTRTKHELVELSCEHR